MWNVQAAGFNAHAYPWRALPQFTTKGAKHSDEYFAAAWHILCGHDRGGRTASAYAQLVNDGIHEARALGVAHTYIYYRDGKSKVSASPNHIFFKQQGGAFYWWSPDVPENGCRHAHTRASARARRRR